MLVKGSNCQETPFKMEVILHAVFLIILWFLSSTVFLPFVLVLLCSQTCSNIWFSFVYSVFVLGMIGPQLIPNRKRLFKMLEKEVSDRDKSIPLKVLEIGAGDGANLQFYPENSKLTVLDMNPSFERYFHKNRKKHSHVDLEGIVHCMAENMTSIPDNSMDVVVGTYVLCSVADVDRTLKEIKRVLKPGGKYLFLEHVIYETRGWHYLLQRVMNPLWRAFYNGCNIVREHKSSMDQAGFTRISYERFVCTTIWLYARPHFIGVATK